jgi:hypothetical protein
MKPMPICHKTHSTGAFMSIKTFFIASITLTATLLWGCAGPAQSPCKLLLFPYVEYNYQANTADLTKIKSTPIVDGPTIDLFNLVLRTAQGWEIVDIDARTMKFTTDFNKYFILHLETKQPYTGNPDKIKFVGCDASMPGETFAGRTDKEFYTDLYHFTDDQLDGDPTLWQAYILWSKNRMLHYAETLTHYKGRHLEAFLEKIEPKSVKGNVHTRIAVFPDRIAPDYITLESDIAFEPFFTYFLAMIDMLNP